MINQKKILLLIVSLLIVALITNAIPPIGEVNAVTITRRVGLWIPFNALHEIYRDPTPRSFADQYFHKAPYFGVAYFLFDNILPVWYANYANIRWLASLAKIGDIEGLQICIMFAINYALESEWVYLSLALSLLAGHSSIAYIGIQGEYFGKKTPIEYKTHDAVIAAFRRFKSLVESKGFKFGMHYRPSGFFSRLLTQNELAQFGLWLYCTNYPYWDPINTLSIGKVGFHGGIECGIWNKPEDYRWSDSVVKGCFDAWAKLPDSVRQYNILCSYKKSDGSFTYLNSAWLNSIYRYQKAMPNLKTMES